jgi:hypothetical protein
MRCFTALHALARRLSGYVAIWRSYRVDGVFCAPRIPYFNDFSMALPPKVLGRLAKAPIREGKYFASYKTKREQTLHR